MLKQLYETADFIKSKISSTPQIAIVLGTGLGYFANLLEIETIIPYADIPHFPISTAPDHAGRMVFGKLCGRDVLLMQGRIHYYEGYSMDEVVYPVRTMKLLGIQTLIVTNAVGAINLEYQVGDIMLISDHIKFFDNVPLRGENISEFGPRFNDLSDAYTEEIRTIAKQVAKENGIDLKEGIYAYMPGPCFETPAEIRMLRILGADVVGMSTVPEVIVAAHAGIQVMGLSFCTNMAAGIYKEIQELSFTEKSKDNFDKIVQGVVRECKTNAISINGGNECKD